MLKDIENLIIGIQMLLKKDNQYKGDVDGKFGPQTLQATKNLLKSYGIDTSKWTNARVRMAAEQAFYRSQKIDVGGIDGLEGPLLRHAREVYRARLVETWRDVADKIAEVKPPVPTPVIDNAPHLKWPTQAGCSTFYGKVGTNQVDCILPFPMVLAWDNKQKIKKYSCHKLVKEPMERIWQRTLDHYGYEKIRELRLDQWGGCLAVRKMRGGASWSMHSWGIAVDIDPDNNQMRWGKDKATLAKPVYNKFWEFVYDEGAISLGKERNFDWMHFQFARFR